MPLSGEGGKEASGNYCQYCSDERGSLKQREVVQKGIADWLKQWAPEGSNADFMKRADHYMKAMPAWAKE